uniref:Uncharacterized protein n=1 Tax=Sphaerodactylus townsendi TaxID=933632 RepID=A0ACB8FF60_9SAUR
MPIESYRDNSRRQWHHHHHLKINTLADNMHLLLSYVMLFNITKLNTEKSKVFHMVTTTATTEEEENKEKPTTTTISVTTLQQTTTQVVVAAAVAATEGSQVKHIKILGVQFNPEPHG